MPEQREVKIIQSLKELDDIRHVWENLSCYPEADIEMYRTHMETRKETLSPYIILLLSDGTPETLLIGRIEVGRLRYAIGYKTLFSPRVKVLRFIFGGFLGDSSLPASEKIMRVLLTSLEGGAADIVIFDHLPADLAIANLAKTLPRFFQRDHFSRPNSHWFIALPESFETYLSFLSTKSRRNVRRHKKRILKKYPGRVTIKCFRQSDELVQMMEDIEKVAAKTYQRGLKSGFAYTPDTFAWVKLASEKGWLRGYILYIDGNPRAFEIGLQYGDTFFGLHTGYDPAYSADRPGTVLIASVIEELCEDETVRYFDFGFGDARYKQDFSNMSLQEKTVSVFAPTTAGLKLFFMHAVTTISSRIAISVSKQCKIYGRLKKDWRRHLAHKSLSKNTREKHPYTA